MSLTSLQKLDVLAAHYARRGLPDEAEWARFVQTVRANEAVNSPRRRFAALDALPLARRLTLTRDIVVEVPSDAYDPGLGYRRIPKPFQRIRNDGYTARLKATAANDEPVWLRYLDWRPNYDPADEET